MEKRNIRQSVTLSTVKCRVDKQIAETIDLPHLELNPFWQRKYECWRPNELTKLVETLLLNRAMNPIWVVGHPEESRECVLDGMHRLTTCIRFLKGEFPITGKYLDELCAEKYNNKYFNDLDKEDQGFIKNYAFEFNLLDNSYYTNGEKRSSMYNILNRISYTLNDFEYNNNIYHRFYDLLRSKKKDFQSLLCNKTDSRGVQEYELLETYILATEYDFRSWSSINKLRERWENNNLKKSEIVVKKFIETNNNKLSETFSLLCKMQNKLKHRNFFEDDKKLFNSNYILYKFMISRSVYYLRKSSNIRKYIDFLVPEFIKLTISSDIVVEIMGNNTKGGRNAAWQKGLIKKIDEILETVMKKSLDKKRCYTLEEKRQKWEEQNKKCAICEKFQFLQNCQGDHIQEYSNGGKTTYENLQVLCIPCHEKKTSNFMKSK